MLGFYHSPGLKQPQERIDLENWLAVAKRLVSGKLVLKHRDEASAVLIGLRHYRKHPEAEQAIAVIGRARFPEAEGAALVKRWVEEWGKPEIR